MAGTATTGAAIGAAIALAETVFREAWLEVIYGPGKCALSALGENP